MRITDNMALGMALRGQARATERLYAKTKAAASGRRVQTPSDDPAAYATAARHESRIATLRARGDAATRASGDMQTAETALDAAGDLLMRARALAVGGATGTLDPATRAQAAQEAAALRATMIGLANSRGMNGYLFGGTRTDAAPFTTTGTFTGNDATIRIEVADGTLVAANVSGARAFTAAGGRDLLADLQDLSDALAANDVPRIRAAIGSMDADHSQLLAVQVDAGLGHDRLQIAVEMTENATIAVTEALGREVEGDIGEVYATMVTSKNALQQSIAVTREILSLSAVPRR